MTHVQFFSDLNTWIWYLFLFTSILFCISGTDELFLDVMYWVQFILNKIHNQEDITYERLNQDPEKKIAIMVPCWHEHLVIGNMISYNVPKIHYTNYDIFIGVYPNDDETIQVVKDLEKKFKNVHAVVNTTPGPTTKSDNLNGVYEYILSYEKKNNISYDIFLLHDSEDVIHPYSLKLYNIEIPDYDMVQTPVIPVAVSLKYQTHWIYNDEFAEIHLKDITARNMMGGFVPSAGVGTALSRRALNTLEKINGGSPFSKNSLTEDYDSALKIHLAHLKTRFLFKTLPQTKPAKKWIWFGKTINKSTKEYIATRSLFPKTYRAALRQRTRWMMGISLQEWNNIGWPGDFVTLYSLAHDRKSVFSNFITLIAYLVSVYWLIDYIYGEFFPGTPVLSQLLAQHPSAYVLIVICSSFMIIRLTQRFLLTARIYGFWAGLTSIPRVFYANFLNANTAFLAIYLFLKAKFFKKTIQWIKTTNAFPTDIK